MCRALEIYFLESLRGQSFRAQESREIDGRAHYLYVGSPGSWKGTRLPQKGLPHIKNGVQDVPLGMIVARRVTPPLLW